MSEIKPDSVNLGRYDGGDYLITAGEWNSPITGTSYEIGIRHQKSGRFWLLQNHKWNFQSVQEVANMISTMLADKTQCYDPDWMREYLT